MKIPSTIDQADLRIKLTNLRKSFWPTLGITKGDLIQYYADVARVLLPHLRDRAMVMKRYPDGAEGEPFFMKRTPEHRPEWIETCSIAHASGNVIDFPVIGDLPSLLWLINLGCIDLNQWYARCDDVDRPDYLHFDLDPGPEVTFSCGHASQKRAISGSRCCSRVGGCAWSATYNPEETLRIHPDAAPYRGCSPL